jgi:hypothetical protein
MRSKTTRLNLTAILKRANAATHWTPNECGVPRNANPDDINHVSDGQSLGEAVIQLGDHYEGWREDWVFLAHAREDVVALAKELQEARRELRRNGIRPVKDKDLRPMVAMPKE